MKPLLLMRKRNLLGPFFGGYAGWPNKMKAGGIGGGDLPTPCPVITKITNENQSGTVTNQDLMVQWSSDVNIAGCSAGDLNDSFLIKKNGTPILGLAVTGVTAVSGSRYEIATDSDGSNWNDQEVSDGEITVDFSNPGCWLCEAGGNPIPNRAGIVVQPNLGTIPQALSGRVFESGGAYYVEITFNVTMIYTDLNGVTVQADGNARAVSAISGYNSTVLRYTISSVTHLNVVTWSYAQASGNHGTLPGQPLPDQGPITLTNEIPGQTFWDPDGNNDPTTFWDGNPPNETEWDVS